MKHLFIINPTAGEKDCTDMIRSLTEKAFRDRPEEYEIYVTKAPMDAADKIRAEAASGELLRVYACGGDGTFNECVCGAAGLENAAVCPFPTGTGNDFCRMFGKEKELYRNLNALLDGSVHPIDVIDCNGRYCANICSVGIDARVGMGVHKYSKLPLVGGAAAYVVSAVVEIFRGITRNMRIQCGNFIARGEHTLVCACNGRYYGGGFKPSLDAMPDDGLMDIFIVKAVDLITLIAFIGKYAAGKAKELPKYVTHMRAREIEIGFDSEDVVNVDGEAMHARKAVMRLIPAGLNLIVPHGMKFFEKHRASAAAL